MNKATVAFYIAVGIAIFTSSMLITALTGGPPAYPTVTVTQPSPAYTTVTQTMTITVTSAQESRVLTTPNVSLDEIRRKALDVDYDSLFRYNERYVGEIVHFKGQIVQVIETNWDSYTFRIATARAITVS